MDRSFNQDDPKIRNFQQQADSGEQEVVEFHSEMPQVSDDQVEFIADEQLEEEITEEI